MKKNILTISLISLAALVYSQEDMRYYGAGEEGAITATTSDNGRGTDPKATYNANGMDAEYMAATRFLAQAALGYEEKHVEDVMRLGFEKWIDRQLNESPSNYFDLLYIIHERQVENFWDYLDRDLQLTDSFLLNAPRAGTFQYAWWHNNLNNEDLLRQRVAFALSEIFVISLNSDLGDTGEGLATYYDLLVEHAFGNFRDLLFNVTLNPSMGFYLSHLNNPKSDPRNNIIPDENYAREIMQLFTIGLYELNQDGSRKIDNEGKYIPTYDLDNIKGLAKVFTGLGPSAWNEEWLTIVREENGGNVNIPIVEFGRSFHEISFIEPMAMYEDWHESGEKKILRNNVIPNGQTGMKDINDAVDILFNHENVGPFISLRLIQRLVKSNPSSGYISRISSVFNNNGEGIRGDLKAVVKAILLDEEARSCKAQLESSNGMLKEPFLRLFQILRSVDKTNNELGYFETSYQSNKQVKQSPLSSPTVFNFFQPNYIPTGQLSDGDLFGPEYQIHDSQTSIGYMNAIHEMTQWETLGAQGDGYPEDWDKKVILADYSRLDEFNNDFESLINHLDKFYVNGRLSDKSREIIRNAIFPMKDWEYMYRSHIRTALNLILISPDYTIMK